MATGNPLPAAPDRFYSSVNLLLDLAAEASGELAQKGITSLSENLITTARGFLGARKREEFIQKFIEKGHMECWDKVRVRDAQFFMDNASRLFGDVEGFDMNLFQDVFRKDAGGKFLLSEELIEDVWANLESMIRISINYIHTMRKPGQVINNGATVSCYYNSFYDTVELQRHASTWNIVLMFQ